MSSKRIAIHSVPRSGSTWLGNIFNSHPLVAFRYQPLFSYAYKDALHGESSKQEIIDFFDNIASSSDDFINQVDGIEKGIIPTFEKGVMTHICYKEVRYHHLLQNILKVDDELFVIGLIRNPMAVINSWLNAPKEFRKDLGWKVEEEWRFAPKKNLARPEEFNGFEKWKEVTQLFLELQEEYPEQFLLVSYEELLEDLESEIVKIFSFCELQVFDQTIDFISTSTSLDQNDPYSVFKNKKNESRSKISLPRFIIDEIKSDSKFQKFNKVFNWI